MAQRVSGSTRKSGVGRTGRLDYASRVNETQTSRAIPLNLGPMLAVYKNRRRLSLRIERMPPLARLSAGRNNGDNSWSLAFSEIDTLGYLPPEGSADETVTLSVRVIDLDGGGSTIAVLDLSVSPTAAEEGSNADTSAREAQLRSLREELEQAKAALKARDSDLTQLRQKAQRAESELSRRRIESEFGGGRSSRKGEVDESKFASLDAGLLLRKGENPPAAAAAADSSDPPGAFLVRKGEAQPSKVALDQGVTGGLSEDVVLARIAEARRLWQQEVDAALASAEAAWKAEETKRAAAAEAQWCAQTERALAQISARCERAEKALAERESTHAETSRAADRARQDAAGQALARAQAAWRAEEGSRLAAAEAQWRNQSSSAFAALTARCERAEQALSEANAHAEFVTQRDSNSGLEIRRLREECTALRSSLSERDAALASTLQTQEQARESTLRETKETFSKAEAAWKADAAARLAAAEAAWQQKLASTVTQANARCERAETALAEANTKIQSLASSDQSGTAELQKLRSDHARLQARLDERMTAFADAHSAFEEARKTWRHEAEAALSTAQAAWKTDEAARLTAMQASWKEQAANALTAANARCEAAEKALAEARSHSRSKTAQDESTAAELRRLNEETASLQGMLAERETALRQARAAFDRDRAQWQQETQQALENAEAMWKAGENARFIAANVQWQEKLSKVTDESRAEVQAMRERVEESDRLRAELAEARALLAAHDKELLEARLPLASARECWERDAQQSLAAAEAAWKADQAARLAAAEAQWRRQSENVRAELAVRCETAEKSAVELRAQAELLAARDQNSRFELRRLREELAIAQANLASREAELESARAEEARLAEREIVLKTDPIGGLRHSEREKPKAKPHLLRDVAVVACLGVAAVLFYPRIETYVPQLAGLFGSGAVSDSGTPAPAPKAVRPSAVVIHAANVRAGPSANTATSGTLQAGVKVEPVEKRGNWTFVRIEGNAQMHEGWIYSSFLQDDKPADVKTPVAKPK